MHLAWLAHVRIVAKPMRTRARASSLTLKCALTCVPSLKRNISAPTVLSLSLPSITFISVLLSSFFLFFPLPPLDCNYLPDARGGESSATSLVALEGRAVCEKTFLLDVTTKL